MKYLIFIIISLLLNINYSYSQSRNESKSTEVKNPAKITSFTVGNITKTNFLRKKYKIEKVLKKRRTYAKRVSKAHRTCVNTRPKKDPVLITR